MAAYRTPAHLDVRPTDRVTILVNGNPKKGARNTVFFQAILDAVAAGHCTVAAIQQFARDRPEYRDVPVLAEIRHDIGRGYIKLTHGPFNLSSDQPVPDQSHKLVIDRPIQPARDPRQSRIDLSAVQALGSRSIIITPNRTQYSIGEWSRSQEFQQKLTQDGFLYVGYQQIVGKDYWITLDNLSENWKWVIYAFISFAYGGKYMRIGKIEKTGLRGRLTPRYLKHALHLKMDLDYVRQRMPYWRYHPSNATAEMLSKRGRLTTCPWERDMWIQYLVPYGGYGLIYVRPPVATENNRQALSARERQFIERYDPPCNNETRSARKRRAEWIAVHGLPIDIKGPRI